MACKGVSHRHSTTTFSENVVASGGSKLSNDLKCWTFYHFAIGLKGRGEGWSLTSSNKKSSASISGEESAMKYSIPGYLFFDNTQKRLKIKHL